MQNLSKFESNENLPKKSCFEEFIDCDIHKDNLSNGSQIEHYENEESEDEEEEHLNQNYLCSFKSCSKAFKAKNQLKDHMRMHQGLKPYICSWTNCNKRFTQFSSLQKHERIHKGEKPYQCTFDNCHQAFTQVEIQIIQYTEKISNLKRHIRVHTKEKPYKCTRCEKAFNTTSNLKQHQQIHLNHTQRTIFSCDECDKFYYYASNLKKHKMMHQQQQQQQQQLSPQIKEQENSPQIKQNDSLQIPFQKIEFQSFQDMGQQNDSQNSIFLENVAISPLPDLIPNSIYSNYISIIHNGHIDFLINSYLYYYNGDDLLMHELEISPKNPFNEHECNPLEEITHWNTLNSYSEIMQLYRKMADQLKQDGITYAMLINKQNCNSIVCTCHCMKEHQNWQNCVNNELNQVFGQQQNIPANNSVMPIDMFFDQNGSQQIVPQQFTKLQVQQQTPVISANNGLCLCNQTRQFKHQHQKNCGHLMITHGGHIDYIVGNILHYPHGDHCDFHGIIEFYNPNSQQSLQSVQSLQQQQIPSIEEQQFLNGIEPAMNLKLQLD